MRGSFDSPFFVLVLVGGTSECQVGLKIFFVWGVFGSARALQRFVIGFTFYKNIIV